MTKSNGDRPHQRHNLVIGVVGDDSAHESWLSDAADRSFDLCLVYFGNKVNRYAKQAEYYFPRKGIKFQLLHAVAGELGDALRQYDSIWCPDDDIAADTHAINRLFDVARQYRLQIAQPAIRSGDFSYKTLLQYPEYLLRYTRYVEIMCPLFSREAFARVLPTFIETRSGWGIDWVWPTFFAEDELAVVDAVGVDHTRPLQAGGVHTLLSKLGIDPGKESAQVMAKYDVDNRRYRKAICHNRARLRAVTAEGKQTWTRSQFYQLYQRSPIARLSNCLRRVA